MYTTWSTCPCMLLFITTSMDQVVYIHPSVILILILIQYIFSIYYSSLKGRWSGDLGTRAGRPVDGGQHQPGHGDRLDVPHVCLEDLMVFIVFRCCSCYCWGWRWWCFYKYEMFTVESKHMKILDVFKSWWSVPVIIEDGDDDVFTNMKCLLFRVNIWRHWIFKLMISQSSGSESLTFKVVPDQTWSGDFFSLSLGNVCRDTLPLEQGCLGTWVHSIIKSGIKCGVSSQRKYTIFFCS